MCPSLILLCRKVQHQMSKPFTYGSSVESLSIFLYAWDLGTDEKGCPRSLKTQHRGQEMSQERPCSTALFSMLLIWIETPAFPGWRLDARCPQTLKEALACSGPECSTKAVPLCSFRLASVWVWDNHLPDQILYVHLLRNEWDCLYFCLFQGLDELARSRTKVLFPFSCNLGTVLPLNNVMGAGFRQR